MEVQGIVKKSQSAKDENSQIGLLRDVIRIAVIGAEEINDEDFDNFPIAELTELVDEILRYSGLSGNEAAGK
jgi:hypothetical protein